MQLTHQEVTIWYHDISTFKLWVGMYRLYTHWNCYFVIWTSSWHLSGICSIWAFTSVWLRWNKVIMSWNNDFYTLKAYAYLILIIILLHSTYACLVSSTYTCSVWTVHVCANSTASSRTCTCSVIWKPMETCSLETSTTKVTVFLTVSEKHRPPKAWQVK